MKKICGCECEWEREREKEFKKKKKCVLSELILALSPLTFSGTAISASTFRINSFSPSSENGQPLLDDSCVVSFQWPRTPALAVPLRHLLDPQGVEALGGHPGY
jgi:hypothetical protein